MLRFVHAADLHLDSPMRGLTGRTPHLAPLFADATRRAFEGLVDRTLESGARLLIVAGDVYDGDWRDHGTGLFFARQLARLTRAGVRVALIRGNHDAESVISRSLTLPEGVRQFDARRAETWDLPDLGLALHGRSFAERAVSENIARTYPAAVPGRVNIGLLHTSCDGRPDHAPYAPCTPADLVALGYDYWALGHIHAHEVIRREPWIVFPGNLQGRHVRETGPRGAMVVGVLDGRVAEVERLIVDVARWDRLALDIAGAADAGEVAAAAEAAIRNAARGQGEASLGERGLAVRVVLSGATAAHHALAADPAALVAELQAAADRIADRIGIEQVELRTTPVGTGAGPLGAAALLDGLDAAALAARLEAEAGDILGKLPEAVRDTVAAGWAAGAPLPAELAADTLRRGRDLALGRLAG